MLKKNITFKNYDGETVTETHYFHLSQAEIVEIEVSEKEGLTETLRQIIQSEDKATLVALFKRIILMSYGVRSADGRKFDKSEALNKEFVSTGAYSALFMELVTQPNSGVEFVTGILPADMPEDNPNEIVVPKREPAVVLKQGGPEGKDVTERDLSTMSKEDLLALLTKPTS